MQEEQTDITVIGAGPAGSTIAALLCDRGWRVTVVERAYFPRFSIGESLLPRCMDSLQAAGMLEAVKQAGFQIKRGVAFAEGARFSRFDFADQHTRSWAWTWHVQRASFDDILAREAERRGAELRFGQSIEAADLATPGVPRLTVVDDEGERYGLTSRFVCDASGFGRVLPRLLSLDDLSSAPPRAAVFTHVADHIDNPDYRRDQIMLAIHPEHPQVWYWLIGFTGGRASVGVVGDPEIILAGNESREERLRRFIGEEPNLAPLLAHAVFDSPVSQIDSYAHTTPSLYGDNHVLLGNSAGFIDPIFSSGVTVALESALLAADPIDRKLRGETPDWETDFEAPLRAGLNVFRVFIEAWYRDALKHVFFAANEDPAIQRMLTSILAGEVWDSSNPYVDVPKRRLDALCRLCAP